MRGYPISVSETAAGFGSKVTYAYDAAGRLVTEGNKTYRYGYLDKVLSVTDGDTKRTFTYHADGQLATANNERADANRSTVGRGDPTAPQSETFLWDGLALVRRGDEQFINEPHVGGGNPVASSKGTSYFNDALGTTVGAKKDGKYSAAALTAFGERLDNADGTSPAIRSLGEGWFTGKPYVEGLGHAFLMRNYRAGLAKWQTADPIGYSDGWNQLAYVNNGVTSAIDWLGALKVYVWSYRGKNEAWGHASLELDDGTYISWWPEGENRDSIPYVEEIYTADAIKNRTFAHDIKDEDDRMPDVTIFINGLDENAISEWWNTFKNDQNNKWETLSQNCSTTVADALKAGNASTPWWDFWSSWNIVWTPADVENFAHAINRKLE